MGIKKDIHSLSPTAIIELFTIDMSNLGLGIVNFHAGTNKLNSNIVWQGITYTALPVEASGFEITSSGTLPRPSLKIANIAGLISSYIIGNDDLLGSKVTRKRTLSKYLDAINFTSGINNQADATQEFSRDVYYINRKVIENKVIVEFSLTSSFDVSGVMLPRRQIIQNYCPWKYKGTECGYRGSNYFTINDVVTTQANDRCGKRLNSCKLRFGSNAELPYGGFPSAGLVS